MARHYTCDFCGQSIDNPDEDLMVTLSARGHAYNPDGIWGDPGSRHDWVGGDVGYYHATEDHPCWGEMLDRLGLIHSVSSDLGLSAEGLNRRREQRADRERQRMVSQRWCLQQEEARAVWRDSSWEERERLLLDVLGDERLMSRDLAVRLSEKLGADADRRYPAIGTEAVRAVAMRLLTSGQVERAPEGTYRGHVGIQLWSRRSRLEGPIAGLEQAYHDEAEAA